LARRSAKRAKCAKPAGFAGGLGATPRVPIKAQPKGRRSFAGRGFVEALARSPCYGLLLPAAQNIAGAAGSN